MSGLVEAMDQQGISDHDQVWELLSRGFSLLEIVEAGFSKEDILQQQQQPTEMGGEIDENTAISEEAYQTALDQVNAAAASAAEPYGPSTTLIATVVGVVILLAVAGVAMFIIKNRRDASTTARAGVQSFENPMYSDIQSGPETTYMDVPAAAASTAGYEAGYMDFPAAGSQQAGYMDVSPTAKGDAQAAYVDVSPNNFVQGTAAYMDVVPNMENEQFGGFKEPESEI